MQKARRDLRPLRSPREIRALKWGSGGEKEEKRRDKSCWNQPGLVTNEKWEVREKKAAMVSCLWDWLEPIMEERR